MAYTFRIASSHIIKTSADRRLPSTDSVLTLLKWIERHFAKRKPSDPNENFFKRVPTRLGSIQMEIILGNNYTVQCEESKKESN